MKRVLHLLVILACIGAVGSVAAAEPVERRFGFGGGMAMAFFPDTAGMDAFLSENELPPMGDALLGVGGSGRGGVLGGPVFGGIGWSAFATSENRETHVEWLYAAGGFDVGCAIGGDANSVLTLGAVLGAAASILSVDGYLVETVTADGLVAVPTDRELGVAMGFVQPYVSMAAQLLSWMGVELRLGYIVPVFEIAFGDDLGIPAPPLGFSGPTVSVGLVFGGISSGLKPSVEEDRGGELVSIVESGVLPVAPGGEIVVRNALGDISISAIPIEAAEPPSEFGVEWQATRTAKKRRIHELQVASDSDGTSSRLETLGTGRVDYILRVPAGVDLSVKNGAGNVTVIGHEAVTVIVESGIGEIVLRDVRATALIVAGGLGRILLPAVEAQQLIVDLGAGDVVLTLPETASAAVTARARLGNVSIDRFPGMIGGTRGFLGGSADVTLGAGERAVRLDVGLGNITIEKQTPR